MIGPRITQHAVERYVERVDHGASRTEARLALRRIVSLGRSRPVPRHWMRDTVGPGPGVRFVYCADRPGICLVVLKDSVVTVITRQLCRQSRIAERRLRLVSAESGRPVSAADRARWRWDGTADMEAA